MWKQRMISINVFLSGNYHPNYMEKENLDLYMMKRNGAESVPTRARR